MRIKLNGAAGTEIIEGAGKPAPSSHDPRLRVITGHKVAVLDARVCRASGSMSAAGARAIDARKQASPERPEQDAELVRAWGSGVKPAPSRAAILATARGAVRLAFGRERSLLTWTEVKRALDRATE